MAMYKNKPDPLGTTRITGKELEEKYASDPEGRFEIVTAWGITRIDRKILPVFSGSRYGWYLVSRGVGPGNLSQKQVEELPEIFYTHSAFLTKE